MLKKQLQDSQKLVNSLLTCNKSSVAEKTHTNEWLPDDDGWAYTRKKGQGKQHQPSNIPVSNKYAILSPNVTNEPVSCRTQDSLENASINKRVIMENIPIDNPGINNNFNKKVKTTRPNICYNETYVENMAPRKVVPGLQSFSDKLKYGNKLFVVGDSHVRRLEKRKFDTLPNTSVFLKSYSGANLQHFAHHITPTLLYEQPDSLVIHIGSNDVVRRNLDTLDVEQLAQGIIEVGKRCFAHGVKNVMISSIFTKRNRVLTAEIRKVNDILRDLCRTNHLIFIDNDDVRSDHLDRDGVHLDSNGSYIFGSNIVNACSKLFDRPTY